jgi:16S rRNA (adenine1518-N6/adenine1519-N6)-dimethyltransferase
VSYGRSQKRKAKWGQNFLINQGACARIVDAAGDLRGRAVLEVGPGRGALTRLLVDRAAVVLALEIDPALAEALTAELPPERFVLRLEDAVAADWSELASEALARGAAPPVPLVANLPYESGTAILSRWLAASAADARLGPAIVMLQREVAERLAGTPSTKAYGWLAVMTQATHRVRTVLDVSPGSFRPPPKVSSRVLRLDRRDDPLVTPAQRETLEPFLQAAFGQRRKQMAVALNGFRGRSRDEWQRVLERHGHSPAVRAEALAPEALVAIALDEIRAADGAPTV